MQGLVLKKRRGDLCLKAVIHERFSKQDFRLMMSFITGEVERRNEFAEWHNYAECNICGMKYMQNDSNK